MNSEDEFPPRVLSDEEIELYLKGDRREVDRLILFSLNRLSSCLIPHIKSESEFMEHVKHLGGMEAIASRAHYVDSLIKKNTARSAMMEKVSQSTVVWAFLAFCGFIAIAVWDSLIHAIKLKLGA